MKSTSLQLFESTVKINDYRNVGFFSKHSVITPDLHHIYYIPGYFIFVVSDLLKLKP